jgi:small acid-soluble spore protein (thioredoxin-like protein)
MFNKRRDEIMKNKPDDRRDNVDRIQYNIDKTILNCELADELIAKTDDPETKQTLKEKNKRREGALRGMREEIKDEAQNKENGYR